MSLDRGIKGEENDATALRGTAALVETDECAKPSAPSNRSDASAIADHVRRARGGDQQAFAWLVDRYGRMVLRTAAGLLGSVHEAQDAAQETFLRMHKHLGGFDASRDPGPWLYRIVVNACRDIGRRRSAAALVPLEDVAEKSDPTARFGPHDIEAAVSMTEQRRVVRMALATLPEKERTAIVLRDVEGLSTAEVARILRSSEGTVRSQICTARLKIRAFVDKQEPRR